MQRRIAPYGSRLPCILQPDPSGCPDATRVTRDVDSLVVPHGVVLDEARNVAQELGLPTWWLNEQASVYISGKDDPGKRRVFDHPGLRVTAA
jgi:hypothetical protein